MSVIIDLGEWGRLQVVIADTDVTFFRGFPITIDSWSSGDPFGDAAAVLIFPQITPFEVLGVGDLFWCQQHQLVDINLVFGETVTNLWEGMTASIDTVQGEENSHLRIECIGALYQLDYYIRPPVHFPSTIDDIEELPLYEEAISNEFHPPNVGREALRIEPLQIQYPDSMTSTEWRTRYAGSWEPVLTGYIQRLLADMVQTAQDPGPNQGQWTLMKDPNRQPVLKLREEEETHYHITAGAPGVTIDLKSDWSQTNNVIFGEGSDESETAWRNADITIDDDGSPITVYYPIGWDETVHPANKQTSERGEPTDPPPAFYSPNYVRIEQHQQYGSGITLRDARRSANNQVGRELAAGWFGTITLRTDTEEISKFQIEAGKTLRIRKLRGVGPLPIESWDALHDLDLIHDAPRFDPITRVEYAENIVSVLEFMGFVLPVPSSDVFTDTSNESVNKLGEAGIVVGTGEGLFEPDEPLLRGQLAGIMVQAIEWATGTELTYSHNYFFDDDGSVHEENINKAVENYLIFGFANTAFGQLMPATHSQSAIVLQRMNRFLGGDIAEDKEGLRLHIAQVQVNFQNATVDLTVDSRYRDLATIDQLIERNKQANKSPAKLLMANRRSAVTDDTKFPWDYEAGSGSIPQKARTPRAGPLPVRVDGSIVTFAQDPDFWVQVNGGSWTIVPVVMSGKGSVQRTEIRAFDVNAELLAIPFHVGVYALEITSASLPNDPFAPGAFDPPDVSGDVFSGFDDSAIVLWGQFEQRAGYWPGLESEGNSPTGVLIDEGTWQFQLDQRFLNPNTVWVAFYASQTAYFQGRFFHGVQ